MPFLHHFPDVTLPKTNMTMEKQPFDFEDVTVSPIENISDFPWWFSGVYLLPCCYGSL